MKTKIRPLRRGKKVYYFKHHNGVLENKKHARLQAISGTLVALFIVGGVGALSLQVLEMRQENAASNALQRQAAPIDTSQKASEEDKLKNADKKAREDEQLAKKVLTKLKNVPGGQDWSVYIRDVKSDRMVNINADEQREAASLSNLLITAPLESKFPSEKWRYRAGNTTVAKCVEALISAKDESWCRRSIDRYADVDNATSILKGFGLKDTKLSATEEKTSARDMGELLFNLQNSGVLSDKARRAVFDGLYGHSMREGIPAGCDQSCLVANITAENENVRHDAAVVTAGESQYVLVIMTKDASWSQISDVAFDIRLELQP